MATERYCSERLRSFFEQELIGTLPELKEALGTTATMTVFRKLETLGYLTSYSHRGKYYTLSALPDFDALGLWSCRSVWFSQRGNLVETVKGLVDQSEAGLTARELQSLVHVECKRPLLALYRGKRLGREQWSGVHVYLSVESAQGRRQSLLRRETWPGSCMEALAGGIPVSHELKAALVLFFSLLDEKQRRLYAGLEAHKLGHGGDRQIAELLGLDAHTVAKGRRELFTGDLERDRVRRAGGGRKPVEKKRPRS